MSTMPAMMTRKKMNPSTASTPMRQLSSTQLTLSVTAMATRQMPRTVKKMADRRRPEIMKREYRRQETGARSQELEWAPSAPCDTPASSS